MLDPDACSFLCSSQPSASQSAVVNRWVLRKPVQGQCMLVCPEPACLRYTNLAEMVEVAVSLELFITLRIA